MKPELKILRGVVCRSNCDCNLCRVAFGKEPRDRHATQKYRRNSRNRRYSEQRDATATDFLKSRRPA